MQKKIISTFLAVTMVFSSIVWDSRKAVVANAEETNTSVEMSAFGDIFAEQAQVVVNMVDMLKETTSAKSEDVKEQVDDVLDTVRHFAVMSERRAEREIPVVTLEKIPTLEEVIEKYTGTIYYDMDVSVLSGFSKTEFKVLMEAVDANYVNDIYPDGFYGKYYEAIWEICNKYQVNEIFLCGIISLESGWGNSEWSRYNHNYTGIDNGYAVFDSPEDCFEYTASLLHNKYLSTDGSCYNGVTMDGVAVCYCGPSWPSAVYGRMCEII